MSDNGKIEETKEETKEIPAIEMRIISKAGEPMTVFFPFLQDKIATYGFLKIAEKILDEYYSKQKPLIQPAKSGGIMNFARRIFHK